MNIPKRNFSGWKPLPLEVLKQGFQLTLDVSTFKISKPASQGSLAKMLMSLAFLPKPADLPKHSLSKVEEATLHPDVWKVALNGRHQGCFEITNKFRRIKFDASALGWSTSNIQLYVGRSFLTVKQYTTGSSLTLMNT
ncbi:hypothetical protein T11_281 [Trichinella zimbabwensis]|nr:hypothetical protein T11_281 [Trichinella zimbabwensis]